MKETAGMFLVLGDNSTVPRTICHPSRHHAILAASLAIGAVGSLYTYKDNPGHFHFQLAYIYLYLGTSCTQCLRYTAKK